MRTCTSAIAAFACAIIAGCSDGDTSVLGNPVAFEMPASAEATGPRLSSTKNGGLVLSWMERHDDGTALVYAPLVDGTLRAPREVVVDARMFVNWADLPSVMQLEGDHWVAHWLRYSADLVYSYDVVVSQSFDGGRKWSMPVSVHDDGTPTEHGFVSMHTAADGVGLLWLDGRDTAKEPTDNRLDTSMTLRAATSAPNGTVIAEQRVDDAVCDCCQTDVAVAGDTPVAVYRDRTAGEIRDIYVTRYIGGAWSAGTRLHADDWVISGCPVNGPSIVARGEDVAVAWFSAARDTPVVRVTRSSDGGRSFDAPIEVAAGRLAGYVGLAALPDGSLAVSWVERTDTGKNELRLRHVGVDGMPGTELVVAEIGQLRVFPQLGYLDGALVLFWTDDEIGERRLHGASIPVADPAPGA